jgi:hypothetical protein
LTQQHHSEPVGFELGIEFARQVYGMSLIAETDFFIFGTGIAYQEIGGFEIDGLVIVKHSVDARGRQNLFAPIGITISLLSKYPGFGAAHRSLLALFMLR